MLLKKMFKQSLSNLYQTNQGVLGLAIIANKEKWIGFK
jgi:hypothetical protein